MKKTVKVINGRPFARCRVNTSGVSQKCTSRDFVNPTGWASVEMLEGMIVVRHIYEDELDSWEG